jgi:hypothetical protein
VNSVKFLAYVHKNCNIKEHTMGQQLNKVQKRRRRKAYITRCKAKVQAAIKSAKK